MIANLLAFLWACALRILAATWTKTLIEAEAIDELIARERLLVGFWHGKTVPLYALFRDRGALIFTSRSFRGDVVGGICRRFGFATASLPDHAGDEALTMMRDAAASHRLIGIALDGPLGPYHAVKRGAIQLASDAGLLLLPLGVASSRARVAKRWDRFEIPLPFSRVTVAAGTPITIPPGVGAGEVAPWAARIREAMEEAEQRAARIDV